MPERSTEALFEELIAVTKQNQRWLKILAMDRVEEVIESALEEPWEYHLFESLDGNKSSRELAEDLPPHFTTINDRLKEWSQSGITEKTSNNRYDKIVSLSQIGIETPELEEDE